MLYRIIILNRLFEEALSGHSSIFNKTLAHTFEKIDILEGWGSEFYRIFVELPPITSFTFGDKSKWHCL